MKVKILRAASEDLQEGYRFYEGQSCGVGAVGLLNSPYTMEGMSRSVIPANAGIQQRDRTNLRIPLDSRFRGNDAVRQ